MRFLVLPFDGLISRRTSTIDLPPERRVHLGLRAGQPHLHRRERSLAVRDRRQRRVHSEESRLRRDDHQGGGQQLPRR